MSSGNGDDRETPRLGRRGTKLGYALGCSVFAGAIGMISLALTVWLLA